MSLFEHRFRELVRQSELMNDGLQIDARFAARTQEFRQNGLAGFPMRGKPDNIDDDLVAGHSTFRSGIANGNRVREPSAVNANASSIVLFEVRTDKRVCCPLDDLLDATAALTTAPSSTD